MGEDVRTNAYGFRGPEISDKPAPGVARIAFVGDSIAMGWGVAEENVFANDATNALAEFFPDDPPRFLARTPHGYHDTALIRSDLEQAGFSSITIETRAEQSRAPSPRHPAIGFCQGTPLRNEIEARSADRLEAATDHAASAIANKHGNGEVAAKIQAHIIVALA